jgi:hypothetical protein
MHGPHRVRLLLLALVAGQVALVLLVVSLTMGWWSGSGPVELNEGVEPGRGVGIDAPARQTPSGSLVLITATPSPSVATPTATMPTPTETPRPAPTTPAATTAPAPASQEPSAPATSPVSFEGRWRIIDVITDGENTGQTYSFDVSLEQRGNRLTGGNGEIQMTGVVTGDTAMVDYIQPALGLNGTFVWTMTDQNRATGRFTNSSPNSGTSVLERMP